MESIVPIEMTLATLLTLIGNLLLLLAVLGCSYAVGARIISSRTHPHNSLDHVLFSLAAGIGAIGTLMLCLGLAGLATPLGLSLLAVMGMLFAFSELRRLFPIFVRTLKDLRSGCRRTGWVLFGVLTVMLVIHASLPTSDFDSLFYHLAIPEQYLREGRVFLPSDNLHAAYIGVMHMLYIPLLLLGSPAAPALFNCLLALALVPLVFRIGEELFGSRSGRMAAMLIWGSPILILVAITPRVDVPLLVFLLLGHHVLLRALADPARERQLWLAGLFLGIAIGVKLSALLYVVALSPLVLVLLWKDLARMERRKALWQTASFVLALIAASLPWLLKNWAWFGSPFYPAIGDPVVEEWLRNLYGNAMPESAGQYAPLEQVRQPFTLASYFFAPGELTPGEASFYFGNPALLLLPLWLLRREQTKEKLWLAVPAVLYGTLVLIRSEFVNLRYLIPAAVPLTIVCATLLAAVLRPALQKVAVMVLLVPLFLTMAIRTSAWPVQGYLTGQLDSTDYRRVVASAELFEHVEAETPSDSKILMLFDARGFGLERTIIPDPNVTNWLRAAPAARDGCLEGTDITHVVVNRRIFTYHIRRGLDPESIQWDEFPAFAARCLTLIRDEEWYQIYRLSPRAPADAARDAPKRGDR